MAASTHETAVRALRDGQAVVFPTDTVYGLGVAVCFADSPQLLFDIKEREPGKPVAWLVSSADDLGAYGEGVPDYAFELAKAFWPGGLTLVVKAGSLVPSAFASQVGTVGFRMPDHEAARQLIAHVGCPLATTSANLSTHPAPVSLSEVDPRIIERASAVLAEDGPTAVGVASTVVDCTGPVPVILRAGCITPDEVLEITGFAPTTNG